MPRAKVDNKAKASTSAQSDPNEQIILSLVVAGGTKGCFDDDLEKQVTNLSNEQRVQIINKLITKRLIDVYNAGGRLIYKIRAEESENTPEGLKGADTEEKIVYGLIKEAGNKGIWMRDIRFESKLQPTVLNKILKALENKKIIKHVKSVAANKKKVYMLYELEPDSSLTGGSWYSDQDFESEFVDVLNQQCYRYLLELKQKYESDPVAVKKGPVALYAMISATPLMVCKFISDLGISKVSLSEDDIQTILETLVFDGKVEAEVKPGGDRLYRAISALTGPAGLISAPCGVCPVLNNCRIDSVAPVSPFSCPYMTAWGSISIIKTDF
ncbi:unnamed protein product [Nezara viridula]|uniref:DNA-directed RNA polymerase III subunit RPC6 n=1 Tax=Nezara viridula TaxID=85310 RepID=A0A9P0EBX6_NEZVI|nr:unnamed protein product [Nezara viridula]